MSWDEANAGADVLDKKEKEEAKPVIAPVQNPLPSAERV